MPMNIAITLNPKTCKLVSNMFNYQTPIDAPPNSLIDSTTSPKVKIVEGEGVGTCSLAHITSGVEGHARALRWD
jgi:hypothetical protein